MKENINNPLEPVHEQFMSVLFFFFFLCRLTWMIFRSLQEMIHSSNYALVAG